MRRPKIIRVQVPRAEPVDIGRYERRDMRYELLCWKLASTFLALALVLTSCLWVASVWQLRQAVHILEHRR